MISDKEVLEAFYEIITPEKVELFERIAAARTDYMTVVVENVRQEHNASAVLRSCDCFGLRHLHVIEKHHEYKIQRDIARGAGRWVDMIQYTDGENPTLECLTSLKSKGYRIVGTTPHTGQTIHDLPIDRPLAFVFGTEFNGISETVEQEADELVRIPMYGFTESFNISVSVALVMNTIRRRLELSDQDWLLGEDAQTRLKLDWCASIVREGKKLENELRRRLIQKE